MGKMNSRRIWKIIKKVWAHKTVNVYTKAAVLEGKKKLKNLLSIAEMESDIWKHSTSLPFMNLASSGKQERNYLVVLIISGEMSFYSQT